MGELAIGGRLPSYRQFAQDLGFGFSNYLHLILQGRRPVSVKAGQTMASALDLKGIEKQYFVTLVQYQAARNIAEREELFQQLFALRNRTLSPGLERDQLEYFAEWYHPVIRELVGLPEFENRTEWITSRVFPPVTPEQVRKSLELLERIGYVVTDPASGKLVQTQTHVRTPPEVRSIALTRFHQKMIEIGHAALTSVKATRRDISALTLTVSESMALEIKSDIQAFRKQLLQKSETCSDPDAVFQVNIQFFPFTKERS